VSRPSIFKRPALVAGLVLCALIPVLAMAVTTTKKNSAGAGFSRVELSVDGMSCSGCVSTIESGLADIDGIADIAVDVTGGKAAVTVDPAVLKDVQPLARAITESGYPARVLRVIPAAELERQRRQAAARARTVIASVGGMDVPRAAFEADFDHARSRYQAVYGASVFDGPRGKDLLNNLKAQIASRLIDTQIQVSEITKAGFVVQEAQVDRAFQSFLEKRAVTREDFLASLEKNRYPYEDFLKSFRTRTLIAAYFDQKVAPGVENAAERERQHAQWFANAKLLAEVVVYDEEIKALIQAGSAGGCGKSCNAKP
jgi:copper chaperone